jgi:hypothetical protein
MLESKPQRQENVTVVTTNPLGSPVAADAETAIDSADAAKAIATRPYSLGQLVAYAFKLGSQGFGGPVALVGYMHRNVVASLLFWTKSL